MLGLEGAVLVLLLVLGLDAATLGLIGALATAIATIVAGYIVTIRRHGDDDDEATVKVKVAVDQATQTAARRGDVDPTTLAFIGAIRELANANEKCERENRRLKGRIEHLEGEVDSLKAKLSRIREGLEEV